MSFLNVDDPELVFALVAPVGTDLNETRGALETSLKSFGYSVVRIKLTRYFPLLRLATGSIFELDKSNERDRILSYIRAGNAIRRATDDNSILAAFFIMLVMHERSKVSRKPNPFSKTAYIIDQCKRNEEVDLLRRVYRDIFFQISIYSNRSTRIDNLSRRVAESLLSTEINSTRADAENIVSQDEHEKGDDYGQRVRKCFHDADVVINADRLSPSPSQQISRFISLLFGANDISPTKDEYGLFLAKAAALRTLDLSRQVGAVICSTKGEIISSGSNEVPKGGGGTYWCDDPYDAREYKTGHDTNEVQKLTVLKQLVASMGLSDRIADFLRSRSVKDSSYFDALEYGRIVHAEMNAITDAARLGRSTQNAILYCTTYPCHMCAKHIVSSGISRVIFLEPYPKSLAINLHSDSIRSEGSYRGAYDDFPCTEFEHFFGITPRRYRELFERAKRKDGSGLFRKFLTGRPEPIIKISNPYYSQAEIEVISTYKPLVENFIRQRQRPHLKRRPTPPVDYVI